MGTGLNGYGIEWVKDEVSIRWNGYRIKYEMEWVQD